MAAGSISRAHFNDPTTGTTAQIQYLGFNSITVNGANVVSQYSVQGTAAGVPTTINTGKEALDSVEVQSTSGPLTLKLGQGAHFVDISPTAHVLDPIQGDVTVNNNQGGGTELNIYDQAYTDSGGANYTIDGSGVSRAHFNDPTTGTTAHVLYQSVNT